MDVKCLSLPLLDNARFCFKYYGGLLGLKIEGDLSPRRDFFGQWIQGACIILREVTRNGRKEVLAVRSGLLGRKAGSRLGSREGRGTLLPRVGPWTIKKSSAKKVRGTVIEF